MKRLNAAGWVSVFGGAKRRDFTDFVVWLLNEGSCRKVDPARSDSVDRVRASRV